MKLLFLALFAAVAVAEPDSDAAWYQRFGTAYPTVGYTPHAATYSSYNNFYQHQYPAGLTHYNRFFKRDAEADSDSDAYWYNRFGTTYNTAGYYPQSTYNSFYQHQYPASVSYYNRFFKRDAEAEPLTYLAHQQQYPFAYQQHSALVGNPVFKSGTFHTNLQNVAKGIHTPYTGYGQVYQPVYNQHHLYKREAEAEPYYQGYPFASTYSGVRYPVASTFSGYNRYPSTYNYHNRYYNGFY